MQLDEPRRATTVLRTVMAIVLWLLGAAGPASAQLQASIQLDGVFYGDNTEFEGAFRTGETILGAYQRLFVEIRPSAGAAVRLGVFGLERAGSHSAVDHALPIVALELGGPRHRFILGTLDSGSPRALGPDRTTPHGLLPPLAVETLWFTRAYEVGLQWLTQSGRFTQDAWFDYQMENTAGHREKFDAGVVGRARAWGPLSAAYQLHIVHHGGQQHAAGPVSDSLAAGGGLIASGALATLESASAEFYVLGAVDRPTRSTAPATTVEGRAVFVRLAAEKGGWRGHLIAWRGRDFNHEDGDPNYLSRLSSGERYRGTRDYAEVGLARLFRPAKGVDFEASFRIHRVESHYGYSYRLLGTTHFELWQGTLGR